MLKGVHKAWLLRLMKKWAAEKAASRKAPGTLRGLNIDCPNSNLYEVDRDHRNSAMKYNLACARQDMGVTETGNVNEQLIHTDMPPSVQQ